jgi:rhodanese-related sulfurtransferase
VAPGAITPDSLFPRLRRFPPPTLLDLRREERWQDATDTIPGAIHRDPEAVATWAGGLEPHRPVVAFCVHGHEVSQGVAAALYDALYLWCRDLQEETHGWPPKA